MASNRSSTFYNENVVTGAPTERVSALYAEVVTNGPVVPGTNRVSTFYFEAVTSMFPAGVTNRVSDFYLEMITGIVPPPPYEIRAMIMP